MVVGAVEALTRPTYQTKRLLEMATTWPNSLSGDAPSEVRYRTARQLRPAEVDVLVKAFEAGASVRELAGQFGVHRSTVGKHLEARGVDTRQLLLGPDDIREASELYQKGETLEALATRYTVSDTTIRTHLLRSGVAMRAGGRRSQRSAG